MRYINRWHSRNAAFKKENVNWLYWAVFKGYNSASCLTNVFSALFWYTTSLKLFGLGGQIFANYRRFPVCCLDWFWKWSTIFLCPRVLLYSVLLRKTEYFVHSFEQDRGSMIAITMKSGYNMESKYRSEGRLSLPRRRVTTKPHENGDFEMELSLAIKESLKYAKEKEGQLKSVDRTSPLLNGVQTDESFSRMAGKMLSFATSTDSVQQGSEEIRQLKDLLLIHIELIQHQQELLASKDKEIRLLRNEKDTVSPMYEESKIQLSSHVLIW